MLGPAVGLRPGVGAVFDAAISDPQAPQSPVVVALESASDGSVSICAIAIAPANDPAGEAAIPDPVLCGSLTKCAAAGLTGVLQVIGDPGGAIYLSGGGVIGVRTPGAPSLEVILLRSGRVPDGDWETAFSAAAAGTSMAAELISRRLNRQDQPRAIRINRVGLYSEGGAAVHVVVEQVLQLVVLL